MDDESSLEGLLPVMHPFEIIPVLTVLVAAAFVAVSIVWDAHRRDRGSMSAIFGCLVGWGFVDLCAQLAAQPDAALFWLKLVHLPGLLLSVCVVRFVAEIVPHASGKLLPATRVGLALAVIVGLSGTVLPGVVEGANATPWGGWTPRYGVLSLAIVPIGCILPAFAAYHVGWGARRPFDPSLSHLDRLRAHAVVAGVSISLLAIATTEFLFPLLEIPSPRLGAIVTVLATASLWVVSLHRSDDLTIAPHATARAVLSRLDDGVALVDLGGAILAANPKLGALVGVAPDGLVGEPLARWVDEPLDSIRAGFEEREVRLEAASGVRLPIALTASCVRDRRGVTNWVVVVFRDLRGVDALRRRLLTSGRLAAVGELAAGIAHEVNNPVAFIRSDLNFLRNRLAEIEAQFAKEAEVGATALFFAGGEARIDLALASIERVAQVVGDVREFAHVGSDGSQTGDPGAIIESAVRLARLERHEEVRLEIVDAEIFTPIACAQDFKQVILSLLRVMTLCVAAGATIRIETRPLGALLRVVLRSDELVKGAAHQIERFDLAAEDMLESSAEDLGLAMAIELIEQLGGAVDVEAPTPDSLRIVLTWPFDRDVQDA